MEIKKRRTQEWIVFRSCIFKGSGSNMKEVPHSVLIQRPVIHPFSTFRSGNNGFGLPPLEKFRSGHMSGVIPVWRDYVSASDTDLTSDSDDDVYGSRRHYYPTQTGPISQVGIDNLPPTREYCSRSLQTQPRGDDIPSAPSFSGTAGEFNHEASTGFSGNVNTVENVSHSVNQPDKIQQEIPDPSVRSSCGENGASVGSFPAHLPTFYNMRGGKFKSGHLSGGLSVLRYFSESASYISSQGNAVSGSGKEYCSRSLQTQPRGDDIPSAPSFSGTAGEFSHEISAGASTGFSGNLDTAENVSHSVNQPHKIQQENPDPSVRGSSCREIDVPVPVGKMDDTGSSSDVLTTQVGIDRNGRLPRTRVYSASYVPSQGNAVSGSEKEYRSRSLQSQRPWDDDIPSAPFLDFVREYKQEISAGDSQWFSLNLNSLAKSCTSVNQPEEIQQEIPDPYVRSAASGKNGVPLGSFTARLPTFHASAQGPWHGVIIYDACVRVCLYAWAQGCVEAPMFLENECAVLRQSFGLQQVLLQSEEELMANNTSEPAREGATPKPKKMVGKIKVQVRKVKMAVDPSSGCSILALRAPKIKLESVRYQFSNFQSTVAAGWHALRSVHFRPHAPAKHSFSSQSLAYVKASTQYIKEVSGLMKAGVAYLRSSSSPNEVQETYSCSLTLKSSSEGDAIILQPGSGESHVFFPESLGDCLVIDVQDSKGKQYGRVLAQVASIAEDPGEKLSWWNLYKEPEHELVGKVQLFINYSTSSDENNNIKGGLVSETVAYDITLETAMKVQQFQERNLSIHGPWKWLLAHFASFYGVSDEYTKLRYLSYVMDVATPTSDCLTLVHDLLLPVVMKSTLSHQENQILGEVEDQIGQILAIVFENYKSLDEMSPSGILDVFRPATGKAAPALEPSVRLYMLLHDILSPEAQNKLYIYFQAAAKKRSRIHLTDTNDYVSGNNEGILMDAVTVTTAYQKMKSLCLNIKNEISTDIEIYNQDILPSFVDLPNLSSAIYISDMCTRLRAFLVACPPRGPSHSVTELVIAFTDIQRDLASWNINLVEGGVDANELFHPYIALWIHEKRLALLEQCKLEKVKWSGVRTQHSTTPFVDEMYSILRDTLNDYDDIICRWPEYILSLENAIADVEKAVVDALDKQYEGVLSPLEETFKTKRFGLKYVQKLANRSVCPYAVPDELGVLLNSLKRMLDVLRPKIIHQLKTWGSCIPDGGHGDVAPGECLSAVTVMLRSKFRNCLKAVVEKLAQNTKLHNSTKLKKILHYSKSRAYESEIRRRMQPLIEQVTSTINHLHTIFETRIFISICRGYWDRMGQDVLNFLENRKENKSWYKGSQIVVSILDDTFASQMQQVLGNGVEEKDVEPPRSIIEVRSMLCKHAPSNKGNTYHY